MYPSIQPHYKTWLHTDTLTDNKKVKVYLECSGNPKGTPVIYLHGGPGDRVIPRLRRLYDPTIYHIILFDQRGCGKSRPLNHTEKNTTKHLIEDMEHIREHLGADKMVVAGGSWGSSLALLYAQAHPTRVIALILRGVYDLSRDVRNTSVLDQMYPEETDKVKKLLHLKTDKQSEEDGAIERTLKKNTKTRRKLIRLLSSNSPMSVFTKMKRDTFKDSETLTVIGEHYESNRYFVPANTIYKHMHLIKHIPVVMVQGRYDMVTPMKMAYKLSQLFTNCKLIIVRAGHTAFEDEITKHLIIASNLIKQYFNI